MPTYDFRCEAGHTTESVEHRETRAIACDVCGSSAARVAVPSRLGISGFTTTPIGERRFPLDRFVEAQGEMIRDAERAGVKAPDVLKIAEHHAREIQTHRPDLRG